MQKIDGLTEGQQQSLLASIQTWKGIGFSTKPSDRIKAEEAIYRAYRGAGLKNPREIIWCQSPLEVALRFYTMVAPLKFLRGLRKNLETSEDNQVGFSIFKSLEKRKAFQKSNHVYSHITGTSVWEKVVGRASKNSWERADQFISSEKGRSIKKILEETWKEGFEPDFPFHDHQCLEIIQVIQNDIEVSPPKTAWREAFYDTHGEIQIETMYSPFWPLHDPGARVDYYFLGYGILGGSSFSDPLCMPFLLQYPQLFYGCLDFFYREWGGGENPLEPLMEVEKHCGGIFPFKKICFVSERPALMSIDDQGRLHKDGDIAIQYPDGWGIYFWQGERIPKRLGSVSSKDWDPRWILDKENFLYQDILMQALGYGIILDSLPSKLLDQWREYSLFQISGFYGDPFHLLAMTCPSTGSRHVLRVPPGIQKAREAIEWVNHGIDPEGIARES